MAGMPESALPERTQEPGAMINRWSTSTLAPDAVEWRERPLQATRSRTPTSIGASSRHGKEGVDGSSPSEGLGGAAQTVAELPGTRAAGDILPISGESPDCRPSAHSIV